MISFTKDELVDVVFVTHHNFVYAYGMKRSEASDMLRWWYYSREGWNKASWLKRLWCRIQGMGMRYQFASNRGYRGQDAREEGAETYADVVVGWEHVVGMYLREREPSAHEKLAEAQSKIVKMM